MQVMSRMEIADLLSDVDTDRYIVVLDHQPNDYDNEAATSADLVQSGISDWAMNFKSGTHSEYVIIDISPA